MVQRGLEGQVSGLSGVVTKNWRGAQGAKGLSQDGPDAIPVVSGRRVLAPLRRNEHQARRCRSTLALELNDDILNPSDADIWVFRETIDREVS